MARLWCETVAVALTAAVVTICMALGLQGAALADSKKPRFGTHPPVKIKPYSKRLVLSCWQSTATIKALGLVEHKLKIRNVKWVRIKAGRKIYWSSRVRTGGAKPKYSGQLVLQYDLMQGQIVDFKVSNKMNGCSAWSYASLTRRR